MSAPIVVIGEVVNAATPTGNGGRVWRYGPGIGVGVANPLVWETTDVAPAGRSGTLLARRIFVPILYNGACTITCTPIVDWSTELPPTATQLTAPSSPTRRDLEVYLSRRCTFIRLRVAVTGLTGTLEFYAPSVVGQPLTGADSAVAP